MRFGRLLHARPLVVPFARWHTRRAHLHVVAGQPVWVPPGVFDPVLTKVGAWLAGAVGELVTPGERWLELGTGSGVVACALARAGATVVATDLDPAAVQAARVNAALGGLRIEVRGGDLFAPVAGERFDAVVANLPFWPGDGADLPLGHAFGAGADFAILRRFGAEAPAFAPRVYTVLSEAFVRWPEARAALGPSFRLHRRAWVRGEWLSLWGR